MPDRRTLDLAPLLALTGLGLVVRLYSGASAALIARDGIGYLEAAGRFLGGEWAAGLAHHYPPGYPLLLSAFGAVTGQVDEQTGVVASALVGAAVVPAIALLALRAFGRAAALYAALAACLLPLHVELGGQVLADSLYLALLAWALVCFQHIIDGRSRVPLVAAAASLLCVAAYLTRPEALAALGAGFAAVLFVPRAGGVRGRLKDVGWLLLPAILGLIPFLLFIQGQDTLDGTGSGSFKLTLKQNMGWVLDQLTPARFAGNAGELIVMWAKTLGPALLLLALSLRVTGRAAGMRLAVLCGLVGGALLVTFSAVRAEERFAGQLALLALPHVGLGGVLLARWIQSHLELSRVVVPLALVACWLPMGLGSAHAEKASYRDAAAVLAKAKVQRVLARDSRVAWYAGAATHPVLLHFFPEGVPLSGAALRDVVVREGFDAVVLVVDDETQRQVSTELSDLLGVKPVEIRAPGVHSLDVFLLLESAATGQ